MFMFKDRGWILGSTFIFYDFIITIHHTIFIRSTEKSIPTGFATPIQCECFMIFSVNSLMAYDNILVEILTCLPVGIDIESVRSTDKVGTMSLVT